MKIFATNNGLVKLSKGIRLGPYLLSRKHFQENRSLQLSKLPTYYQNWSAIRVQRRKDFCSKRSFAEAAKESYLSPFGTACKFVFSSKNMKPHKYKESACFLFVFSNGFQVKEYKLLSSKYLRFEKCSLVGEPIMIFSKVLYFTVFCK